MPNVSYFNGLNLQVCTHTDVFPVSKVTGQYLCGQVAQSRQALVLDNIDISTDVAASGVRAMGIRSYVGLPLSAHGVLLGTLAFGSTQPRFDPADIELLKSVSVQFAATLDRTQLLLAVTESDERQRLAISAAAFATWDVDLKTGRAKWSSTTGSAAS